MDGVCAMSTPKIFYYAGRYAMIKSGLNPPPGTIIYVLLENAMIAGARGKKPTKMKEREYILCLKNSENVTERKDNGH